MRVPSLSSLAPPFALTLLLWGVVSCAHSAPGERHGSNGSSVPQASATATVPGHYPGTLRPPAELGVDFQWRQQVTAYWPQGTHTFDAVLTKTGDELVLLGLGPMDTPGFVLTLNANGEVDVENRTGRDMPFDARYVLLDVQRTFYPWFESPLDNGSRTATIAGEQVTEDWEQGRLIRRTFERNDGKPPGTITVTYSGWTPGARAPTRARLDNGWFEYALEINTLAQQTL